MHLLSRPVEGAAVKIHGHCCSQRCIVPVDRHDNFYSKVPEKVYPGAGNDVAIKFLHLPPSEQGVQECTVLYACHAAGPEQAPMWGHAVMPGIL